MQLIIYTDLHIGAPHEIRPKLTFGDNVFYIGDIVDLLNCKTHLIKPYARLIARILSKTHHNYIRGNHEMDADRKFPEFFDRKVLQYFQIYKEKIYLAHGDFGLLWPIEKSTKWDAFD